MRTTRRRPETIAAQVVAAGTATSVVIILTIAIIHTVIVVIVGETVHVVIVLIGSRSFRIVHVACIGTDVTRPHAITAVVIIVAVALLQSNERATGRNQEWRRLPCRTWQGCNNEVQDTAKTKHVLIQKEDSIHKHKQRNATQQRQREQRRIFFADNKPSFRPPVGLFVVKMWEKLDRQFSKSRLAVSHLRTCQPTTQSEHMQPMTRRTHASIESN